MEEVVFPAVALLLLLPRAHCRPRLGKVRHQVPFLLGLRELHYEATAELASLELWVQALLVGAALWLQLQEAQQWAYEEVVES